MFRPPQPPAIKRFQRVGWQLAAVLAAGVIPAFAQAQTSFDILVNHQAFLAQSGDGDIKGSVDGPAGGEFIYRAKVKINDADGTVNNVSLTQKLPAGAIFKGINQPVGVQCEEPLPKDGDIIVADQIIKCTIDQVTTSFVDVDFRVVLPKQSTSWVAKASATAPDNTDPDTEDDEPNHSDIGRNITTYERAELAVDVVAQSLSSRPITDVTQGDKLHYVVQVSNTDSPYAFPLKEGGDGTCPFSTA